MWPPFSDRSSGSSCKGDVLAYKAGFLGGAIRAAERTARVAKTLALARGVLIGVPHTKIRCALSCGALFLMVDERVPRGTGLGDFRESASFLRFARGEPF